MTIPYTVLVVDDDENLAQIIAETLLGAGYEVQTAHNGLHGYLAYSHHHPDVVLTDIQMPELDGLEMMRCIRASHRNVKTIYISAAVRQYRDSLARESKEYGAIVLIKPFSRNDLLKSVAAVATASRTHSESSENLGWLVF
ncbi:MAG: response regulator [Deltaproteobacteria bacterium]|nr:response regulator [Deltaproteobacteria bacterium]